MAKTVYAGRFLTVIEVAMPDGRVREVVRKKSAVAVLMHDPERDEVVFVRQQRAPFITSGYIFEVPAGHVNASEFPEDAAVREIREETGICICRKQIRLLDGQRLVAVSPGWTDEMMWLAYVELEPGQRNTTGNVFGAADEGEHTEVFWIPVAKLDGDMQFDDLKTFALVQWFLARRREKEIEELREKLTAAKHRIQELEADLAAMQRIDDRF